MRMTKRKNKGRAKGIRWRSSGFVFFFIRYQCYLPKAFLIPVLLFLMVASNSVKRPASLCFQDLLD